MGKLDGKVAIITGAGRGIGRALALKVAADGARVVLNDLDDAPLEETLADIRAAGGQGLAVAGDVTEADFPDRVLSAAIDGFGDIDIVVNNAGYIWNSMIQNTTDEQWRTMLDIHAGAPFRLLRATGDYFRKAAKADIARPGGVRARKVVNVTSVAGTHGAATMVAYAAGKSALVGLTKSLAQAWGRFNVTVNCVAFGLIETRLTQRIDASPKTISVAGRPLKVGLMAEEEAGFLARTALGRLGTSDEAAGAVYLLCLPESDYITGQVLECAGGL